MGLFKSAEKAAGEVKGDLQLQADRTIAALQGLGARSRLKTRRARRKITRATNKAEREADKVRQRAEAQMLAIRKKAAGRVDKIAKRFRAEVEP